ncbi:MAG: glutathione S-transferase family protein [Pseudomonadota bacterium]
MTMKLYDSGFSPFARKVRMVLDHKGLACEAIDGLDKDHARQLEEVNGRAEVPALVDAGLVVVNSADIIAYLEQRYPLAPVYPEDPALRVHARAWERCADSVIDPILVDISYWSWAERDDQMPEGLREAAQDDLDRIYDALERDLPSDGFLCGDLSIADMALFPHMTAVRMLRVSFTPKRHPKLSAWFKRMRQLEICQADLARAKAYVDALGQKNIERRKIFWRGDRIEWLMARGYHDWFLNEITQQRVLWPGLAIPAPRPNQAAMAKVR